MRELLEMTLEFEPSDTRNRVYGLLNVVDAGDQIPVVYSKSAEEVSSDAIQKVGESAHSYSEKHQLAMFSSWLRISWKVLSQRQ
jgi:hypothetical protein